MPYSAEPVTVLRRFLYAAQARPCCRASLFDLARRYFRSIAQRSNGRPVVRNQRKLQSQVQSANLLQALATSSQLTIFQKAFTHSPFTFWYCR